MLIRTCDKETARDLPTKDKKKLLAIITLDSIEEPKLIDEALSAIERIAKKQRIC